MDDGGGGEREEQKAAHIGCKQYRRAGSGPSSGLLSSAAVSKVCASCGKKPSFGNNRSHSMVATRRRFNPNLQRVRVLLNGVAKRAYICTRCLKAGKVQKAV